MYRTLVVLFLAVALVGTSAPAASAVEAPCPSGDPECNALSALSRAEEYEKIVAQADPARTYSEEARAIIGQAYLMMAGRDSNTLEQEEAYCRKALEFGMSTAYMGLYFIHAGDDPDAALDYLRQYIATKPADSVPYVILGEAELQKNNYGIALNYLSEARKVARGRSSNLDWLTFQAGYLLGDYAMAERMLNSAIAQGHPLAELKELMADPRFAGFEHRPEFSRYAYMVKGISASAAN